MRQWIAAQTGAEDNARGEALLLQPAPGAAIGDPGGLALPGGATDGAAVALDALGLLPPASGARSAAAAAMPLVPAAPAFPEALTERVRWQLEEGRSSAELRLDPPSLGSLSVRIRLERDEASIFFISTQPGVREALEDALPKLRELLNDAGLRLVDVSVGGGQSDGDGNGQDTASGRQGADPDALPATVSEAEGLATSSGIGLLDAYA